MESEVPVNPIKWSLSLCPGPGPGPSAFGAGFFDDAGDIPGQVLRAALFLGMCAFLALVRVR